jgi:LacI family transcriptional regulator
MADIAKAAGVSRNTVSLALRKDPLVAEQTRVKIEAIAQEMGYARDPVLGDVMASMRRRKSTGRSRSLAIVNAHSDPLAFRRHPTIPIYVAGCRRRAEELGYGLDSFWMHDPKFSGERFCSIFSARGICGVLIVGMMKENRIPREFLPVIESYAAIVTGVRTREPALSFACVDHHMVALRAFEKALELGYQRPGLVLDQRIDDLVEKRFSAGYRSGQERLAENARLKRFHDIGAARSDLTVFKIWLQNERPDIIFTLYHEVAEWLKRLNYKIPDNIALAQFEWRKNHADWAGMDQHNDLCGETAVDMLIGMIHRGEKGPPSCPRATMISPTWLNGETAPAINSL